MFKNKKNIVILLIVVLLLLLAAFVYFTNENSPTSSMPKASASYLEDNGNALDGTARTKTKDEILDELKKQQLVVTDKLSSNISFDVGKTGTTGKWVVENLSGNNIIQQAEVYFKDTLIAKTTPIYPDQHIESVELKKDIPSGEYTATAYINYYNINTKEFISKAGYKIHLTIH
jgi:hypothetical protein